MATIACPLCFGPTEVHVDGGRCAEGHEFDEAEMVRAMQSRADNALWAALRSLQDQAAFGRIRREAGQSVPADAVLAEEHVETLRQFMRQRAEPGIR